VTVGLRAKFIAEAAAQAGFDKRNIFSFDTAEQAKLEVQGLLEKGDLVLIKGSRVMELNRIVQEIQLI
jgi:UDP-N-acetylmuramoyl-tripeptide--D-alanyl-D-alanine ligase